MRRFTDESALAGTRGRLDTLGVFCYLGAP